LAKKQYDKQCEVEKRSKTSWMGHGAWMKIAWGTWKMGGWG
jgi:hypothetical protein